MTEDEQAWRKVVVENMQSTFAIEGILIQEIADLKDRIRVLELQRDIPALAGAIAAAKQQMS